MSFITQSEEKRQKLCNPLLKGDKKQITIQLLQVNLHLLWYNKLLVKENFCRNNVTDFN